MTKEMTSLYDILYYSTFLKKLYPSYIFKSIYLLIVKLIM